MNSQNCFLLFLFFISSSMVYQPRRRMSKLIGATSELKTGTVPFIIASYMSMTPDMPEYGLISTFGSLIDAISRPVPGSLILTMFVKRPIIALSCTLKYSTNYSKRLLKAIPSSLLISAMSSKLMPTLLLSRLL